MCGIVLKVQTEGVCGCTVNEQGVRKDDSCLAWLKMDGGHRRSLNSMGGLQPAVRMQSVQKR